MNAIELQAVFYTARKTRDGGWQLTLEIDAGQVDKIARLTQHDTEILHVAIIPETCLAAVVGD